MINTGVEVLRAVLCGFYELYNIIPSGNVMTGLSQLVAFGMRDAVNQSNNVSTHANEY
jgi:hypothetical protein